MQRLKDKVDLGIVFPPVAQGRGGVLKQGYLVKIKGGKQYNFTDPMGNADSLFVFQRDVDKARQRLLKGDQPATN